MPTAEAVDLLAMVEEVAAAELAPRAAEAEANSVFPRDGLRTLGELGILGLPFDAAFGGGGQPYEVTLQALEEVARAWLTVGVSVSVHYLACFPVAYVRVRRAARPMAAGHDRADRCSAPTASPSRSRALTRRRW